MRGGIFTTELTEPTEGHQLFSVCSVSSVVNIRCQSPLRKLHGRPQSWEFHLCALCALRGLISLRWSRYQDEAHADQQVAGGGIDVGTVGGSTEHQRIVP